jgi:hypothetical protein
MENLDLKLTHEQLKKLVRYDPDTGVFTKLTRRGRGGYGAVMGQTDREGRVAICVAYKTYYAHRLAWFYMTGLWPVGCIDHIDGDPGNNRFANLRDVPSAMNSQNRKAANANRLYDLPLGVYPAKGGKTFEAQACINRVKYRLGRFPTPELASEAYIAFRREKNAG